MLRKLVILVCLISFIPAAAGAQDAALLAGSQAAVQRVAAQDQQAEPKQETRLETAAAEQPATVVAANDPQPCQPCQPAETERAKKTHPGLTFKEFCEVHFGEYRWIYWVGAVTAIVLFHVLAVND